MGPCDPGIFHLPVLAWEAGAQEDPHEPWGIHLPGRPFDLEQAGRAVPLDSPYRLRDTCTPSAPRTGTSGLHTPGSSGYTPHITQHPSGRRKIRTK